MKSNRTYARPIASEVTIDLSASQRALDTMGTRECVAVVYGYNRQVGSEMVRLYENILNEFIGASLEKPYTKETLDYDAALNSAFNITREDSASRYLTVRPLPNWRYDIIIGLGNMEENKRYYLSPKNLKSLWFRAMNYLNRKFGK